MWTTSTGMAFSLTRVPALGKGGALFFLRLWRARRSSFCSPPKRRRAGTKPARLTRYIGCSDLSARSSSRCSPCRLISTTPIFHLASSISVDALLLLLDRLVAAAAERAQSLLDLGHLVGGHLLIISILAKAKPVAPTARASASPTTFIMQNLLGRKPQSTGEQRGGKQQIAVVKA